jgi:hypothetical protein
MEDIQILLAALWIALMLTYLLGDVMRIFAGDFTPGEIDGTPMTQKMLMGMALLMLLPIVMVIVTLTVVNPWNRWANIIVAVLLFLFNLAGVNSYPSTFDKFLIIVGLVFNLLTIWNAWMWI